MKIKIGSFHLSISNGSFAPKRIIANFGNMMTLGAGEWGPKMWSAIKHWLVPDMRRDRELMTNGAIVPRRLVYGTCRVSGQIAYVETAGANHENLHVIVLLAGHQVSGFGDIYLDDKLISTFGTSASYELFDGSQTTACASLIAASSANQTAVTKYVTGSIANGTSYITAPTALTGLWSGMNVSGSGIPAGTKISYIGSDYIKLTANATATATNISLTMTGTPSLWTSNHILKGCAYIYLKLTYNESLFAGGLPKVTVVVKGRSVYDPRTMLTGFSSNPALCVRDYMLMDEAIGGMGCYISELDDNAIKTAADICDETVVKSTDGTLTEKRYECNGTISIESTPKAILDALLQSMVGQAFYSSGAWVVQSGAFIWPDATLDESWLNGEMKFTGGVSKADRINTVKGSYIDPNDNWAEKDFPILSPPAYITADGGEELAVDLKLNFTTSPTCAQRMAKIVMEQSRFGQIVNYPCNLKAFKLLPGQRVYLNNTQLGWSNRIFKIQSWEFSISGGINLTLKQDDPVVYSWTVGEISTIDLPPATIFPSPTKLITDAQRAATTAVWSGVSGAGKPQDGATVGAQAGVNLKNSSGTVLADSEVLNSAVQVGGRNLLRESGIITNNSQQIINQYLITTAIPAGATVTISLYGTLSATKTNWAIFNDAGFLYNIFTPIAGLNTKTITWGSATTVGSKLYIYTAPDNATASVLNWVKLEIGNKATDWTPAPEDVQSGIDTAATTATWAGTTGTGKPADNATVNYITTGLIASRPVGSDGDTYYATDEKILYQKISGAWVASGNKIDRGDVTEEGYYITGAMGSSSLTYGAAFSSFSYGLANILDANISEIYVEFNINATYYGLAGAIELYLDGPQLVEPVMTGSARTITIPVEIGATYKFYGGPTGSLSGAWNYTFSGTTTQTAVAATNSLTATIPAGVSLSVRKNSSFCAGRQSFGATSQGLIRISIVPTYDVDLFYVQSTVNLAFTYRKVGWRKFKK